MDQAVASALWDLSVRYATAVDGRDSQALLSVFSDDAELIVRAAPGTDRPDRTLGIEQIAQVPLRMDRFERTFHMLGQGAYEVEANHATGTVYCQAHHFSIDATGGHDFVMYIRYHDHYTFLEDGTWRIKSRDVRVEWTESRRTDG